MVMARPTQADWEASSIQGATLQSTTGFTGTQQVIFNGENVIFASENVVF